MNDILNKAIQSVQQSELSYCKFLSPNDTNATKAHQSGYLISVSAWSLFLESQPKDEHIIKLRDYRIRWQDEFETPLIFTYYRSKGEFRITGFGKGFPYREESNVGDLFIICKKSNNYFEGYILNTDEDIDDFFAACNISSADANKIIPKQYQQTAEERLLNCFNIFVQTLDIDFPPTTILASNARNCYNSTYNVTKAIIRANPDTELLRWIEAEYQLFKVIENNRYSHRILTPFKTVEELVITANTILNRRKSRAGKSLEHHLSEIFLQCGIQFSSQVTTEGNKRPDFIFPSKEAYKDLNFDQSRLIMLASKTTCKDRWRQILNEADRIKTKHLFTLQQSFSNNQIQEMLDHNVCLVVPKEFQEKFPKKYKDQVWTLERFISFANDKQA